MNSNLIGIDKNRIKGKMDVVAGTAKQKIGHATGNTRLEVEGAVQNIKGKVETVVGKAADAVKNANAEARGSRSTEVAAEPHRYEKL
jgi:uncharacterized protein YjbJ (UPF0337 family)